MRINRYVASASGLSRRAADAAIAAGRVGHNQQVAQAGATVTDGDQVTLDGQPLHLPDTTTTVLLNKPVGYVCSRQGQGNSTIYELLPSELQQLKSVGRLDKDSSGLLLLTNDGQLAHALAHPSSHKHKTYQVSLDRPLQPADRQAIEQGVLLEDGPSRLSFQGQGNHWTVTMHEGRNRQIRRTFAARGYQVISLHRTQFGNYTLADLPLGQYRSVPNV
jgi:23S rRNA pseudouridine2605 synthase